MENAILNVIFRKNEFEYQSFASKIILKLKSKRQVKKSWCTVLVIQNVSQKVYSVEWLPADGLLGNDWIIRVIPPTSELIHFMSSLAEWAIERRVPGRI